MEDMGTPGNPTLKSDAHQQESPYIAMFTMEHNSSVLRGTGLPFMLLACSAFPSNSDKASDVMP
jgi:hypothetical protein